MSSLQATRAKEPAWSIRYLTNAIELGYPGHAIWAERSASYAALEEYEEALEDALVCVRLNPLSGLGYARKGEALMVGHCVCGITCAPAFLFPLIVS